MAPRFRGIHCVIPHPSSTNVSWTPRLCRFLHALDVPSRRSPDSDMKEVGQGGYGVGKI